jgi:phosphoribosyl 1,2-cyclic phosphodiesterase
MKVRFWGTRGSIATPGKQTNHFGGNTSCIELRTSSGQLLIVDCGTGARPLGLELMNSNAAPFHASILLGHTHWDHIQGFPFFLPAFVPGNSFDIFAPEGGRKSLQETLAGQMEYTYFPVDLAQLPTRMTYHELMEGKYQIGDVAVSTQYLNHPGITLGYRFSADGVTVAYLCDHEPFCETIWRSGSQPGRLGSILHEGDCRHASFMADADLVIHDAQYTPEEYRSKRHWGHSTFEYAVQLAAAAGVRRLALSHHEPTHDDQCLSIIEQQARDLASGLPSLKDVFCACEGWEIDLSTSQ